MRPHHLALAVLAASLGAMPLGAQSGPGGGNGNSLKVEIETDVDFGVAAHDGRGGGTIEIDPATGVRRVTGGLVSVGSGWFSGRARITGTPFARVRIGLPDAIKLNARRGNKAAVAEFTAGVPPVATLDSRGELVFPFAGRLSVADGEEGEFKGRFSITADYE
jgi:hypothetical protein